jgi:hypothetical protein
LYFTVPIDVLPGQDCQIRLEHYDNFELAFYGSIFGFEHIYEPASVTGAISIEAVCGDVTTDGNVNVSDVVFLIAFVFGDGSAPEPISIGDVDCNGSVNVSDVVYLINFVFGDGPEPCAACA